MTSSMTLIPYLLVAAYGLKLAWTGETYVVDGRGHDRGRTGDWVRGAIATIYAAGMIYAGGLKFLLLSAVLYAPGTLLYFVARREQKERIFTRPELGVFVVVIVAAVAAVVALASGAIAV
jgi:arginine:ornithine antiporter/lysine permease